ncbi:class I SAM-dependent methyltransferase [Pseudomonas boanensis]|uniref:class I SAM-dependent methyltransferase n=1 Tax=Metapseudomonas boanensis TaxID=2822138 RepID=UPI0035D41746
MDEIGEQEDLEQTIKQIELERLRLCLDKPRADPTNSPAETGNVLPFPTRFRARASLRCGNPLLLDYLFGIGNEGISGLPDKQSRQLFHYATTAPAARALRCRRRIIARALDDTCAQPGKQARVLCIAGGHFREVELSRALRHGQFAEMCVFDDDETCLATVRSSYGSLGVTTLQGTLEQLLAGQFEFDGFDLVYSAGLCELLDDRTCERLAQRLFHAVKPGGRLLLGNMRPGISAIGFLEGLLDWHPHYRQDSRMLGLLDGIDCNEIASARVFHDVGQRVVFLEAVRYG